MENYENSENFYANEGYKEKWGQIEGVEILPGGNRRITVTVPRALWQVAIQVAEPLGMGNSDLVREGLRLFVAKYFSLHQALVTQLAEQFGVDTNLIRRKLMGRRKKTARRLEDQSRYEEFEEDA